MTQVWTVVGFIDREALTVKEVITEDGNFRIVATEWYLDDEMVRRDCNAILLRPMEVTHGS